MEHELKELEEIKQMVLIAIPKERSARDLYLNAAKKCETEEFKQLFLHLSKEENEHENSLKKILQNIEDRIKELKSIKTR